jgi:PsbP-like protein
VKVTRVTSLLAVALLAGAGCGGTNGAEPITVDGGSESDKRFDGLGFSFTYPKEWREVSVGPLPAGREAPAVVVAPEQAESDGVGVTVVQGSPKVTEENFADAKEDIAAAARTRFGRLVEGPTRITVSGLPALRLEASGTTPEEVSIRSHVTLVFAGTTWYTLECDFAPEHAEEMQRGCDQIVSSFRVE